MFTTAEIEQIKNYCQIDIDEDDNFLVPMAEAAAIDITRAINDTDNVSKLKGDPRFLLAVEKQVKANYDYRGTSSETMQFQLVEPVLNVIHQLRNGGVYVDNNETE